MPADRTLPFDCYTLSNCYQSEAAVNVRSAALQRLRSPAVGHLVHGLTFNAGIALPSLVGRQRPVSTVLPALPKQVLVGASPATTAHGTELRIPTRLPMFVLA